VAGGGVHRRYPTGGPDLKTVTCRE
jgi:hypothetical protein